MKEGSSDYRYFPDPDLGPIEITEAQKEIWLKELPELPPQKRNKYVSEFGLSAYDARVISDEIKIGMTADLEFRVEGNEEKVLVPTVSIVTEKGEKGILKVDKNNSPKFEKIEIGISSGNKTSVIDGLEPGEQIFIDIPPWAKKRK